jgi:hypothetical protein
VISGMLAATFIAIFLVPTLYVLVERFASRGAHEGAAPADNATPGARAGH